MTFTSKLSIPEVSVVITNHNYGRFLPQTIGSVLAQTGVHVEIVVVDNGSTDNSREIIESFGDQISSIYQGDVGQARGRNAGIAKSTRPLISFLDADDYWEPSKLAQEVELISPSVEFVYCGIRQFNSSNGETVRILQPKFMGDCKEAFVDFPNLAIIPAGESCSLVTRSLIEKVGPFDETLSGATGRDFFRRCSGATQFASVAESLVHYRLHDSNFSKSAKAVMDDTALSYQILFLDPDWAFALPKKSECLRKLHLSFLKTNIKDLDFGEAFVNLKKICITFIGL